MSDQQAQELTPEQAARQAWTRTAARLVQVERPDEEWWAVTIQEDATPPPSPAHVHLRRTREEAEALAEEYRQESYRPVVRTTPVDARFVAARLPERPDEGITEAMVEAAARHIFACTASASHKWETIADPGRDLWRHNARCTLEAALAARPVSSEENTDAA